MPTASSKTLTAFSTAMRQWRMHYEMQAGRDDLWESDIEKDDNPEAEMFRECLKALDDANR